MTLLTRAEVAHILQVSVRTIDRLRARGQLRALRVLSAVRFRPEDVDGYLEAQRAGKPPASGPTTSSPA